MDSGVGRTVQMIRLRKSDRHVDRMCPCISAGDSGLANRSVQQRPEIQNVDVLVEALVRLARALCSV